MGVMDGLSLVRQCALAGVSRSSLYYSPAGESVENLAPMREIDEVHLEYPFYWVRLMWVMSAHHAWSGSTTSTPPSR